MALKGTIGNYPIEYAIPKDDQRYVRDGVFIAVQILEYFVEFLRSGEPLKFSNKTLMSKFNCPRTTLQYGFRTLEFEDLNERTFKDDLRTERGEFKPNTKKIISWLKLTTNSKEYKEAPKRSFLRAFVKQSLLGINESKKKLARILGRIEHAKTVGEQKELEAKYAQSIKELKRENILYTRYLNRQASRYNKFKARTEARNEELRLIEPSIAFKSLQGLFDTIGMVDLTVSDDLFNPPDNFKN